MMMMTSGSQDSLVWEFPHEALKVHMDLMSVLVSFQSNPSRFGLVLKSFCTRIT